MPMDSAGNTNLNDQNQTSSNQSLPQVSTSTGKEQEAISAAATEGIAEIPQPVEIAPEVEKAGVTIYKETIELPPDVKKLGVTPAGASVPVAAAAALPNVVLPISDPQVVSGLHTQIANALRWLAVWCMKKLKKAHIALKNIHGKIVRVKV